MRVFLSDPESCVRTGFGASAGPWWRADRAFTGRRTRAWARHPCRVEAIALAHLASDGRAWHQRRLSVSARVTGLGSVWHCLGLGVHFDIVIVLALIRLGCCGLTRAEVRQPEVVFTQ